MQFSAVRHATATTAKPAPFQLPDSSTVQLKLSSAAEVGTRTALNPWCSVVSNELFFHRIGYFLTMIQTDVIAVANILHSFLYRAPLALQETEDRPASLALPLPRYWLASLWLPLLGALIRGSVAGQRELAAFLSPSNPHARLLRLALRRLQTDLPCP